MTALNQVIADAVGLSRLQEWLDTIESPAVRKHMVMHWRTAKIISDDEAELLIDHNGLVSA